MCVIDMEFPENDNDSEHNYVDESDAEYKLLQMVQTGVAWHVNHFIKYSLKEPCRTSHHSCHSLILGLGIAQLPSNDQSTSSVSRLCEFHGY